MDSKTRVQRALAHEKPDRVPFNFWMDRRLMKKYEDKIGHRHWRVTHYDADVIETFSNLPFPTGEFTEHMGTRWLEKPYPMNWKNIEEIPMPDPNAENVFELIDRDLDEFPDRAVIMNITTPWGVIGNIRGYEQVYLDIMDHPGEFKKLSRKICDVMKTTVEKACKKDITALYIQEDVSSAKGPMMSMDMIYEHCLDYAKEMADIAKSHGKPVLFHCCGAIMGLMDAFIGIGVDAVNPLQPHLNDLQEFKDKYGDKLTLYGGLDNTYTIHQGKPEEVEEHVYDVFEKIGKKDGGLIFSTHDLDIETPPENVEAMVNAIKNCEY